MKWAIDENVLAVANDAGRVDRGEDAQCPQVDDDCRIACAKFLVNAIRTGIILLDDDDVVFTYYRRKASLAGQPGTGDLFLMELYRAAYGGDRVERVKLHVAPTFGLPTSFTTSGFDPDDMIYVALARSASPSSVVNAADSDYRNAAMALEELGVSVTELCGIGEAAAN